MEGNTGIFMRIILVYCCDLTITTNNSVVLYVSTDPIIFGTSLNLTCETTIPMMSANYLQRFWYKGFDYGLCDNGFCVDTTKYKEFKNSNQSYNLQINRFEEADINVYGCSYGNMTQYFNVTINETNFEYKPKSTEYSVKADRIFGVLDVEIVINKVYPTPICILKYKDDLKDIDLSQAISQNYSKNGVFYTTQLLLQKIPVGRSSASLNITCIIGRSHIPIVFKTFPNEYTSFDDINTYSSTEVNIVVAIVVSNALLVIFGLSIIILAEKCSLPRCMKQNKHYISVEKIVSVSERHVNRAFECIDKNNV